MPVLAVPAQQQNSTQSPVERWLPFFLCVVTVLLYLPALRFDFVYDDKSQIVLNPLIQSWKTLPLLFHTDVWRFQNPLVVGNYWRPVFMVWLLVNYSVFGLKAWAWHTAVVLLHVASSYLFYRLVVRLSGDRWLAFFAALLFSIHPSHLESVAWVSGATDPLLSIFMLGSLLAFIHSREGKRGWAWITASLLLYAAALLTKETAIVEPGLVIAFVLLFRESPAHWPRDVAIASSPFFLISGLYLIERWMVLHGIGHSNITMPFGDVLITIPSVLWFYLRHLFWPVGLSVYYDATPVIHIGWWNFWWPLLACSALTLAFIAYWKRSRNRLAMFAGVLLILPLLPVLYIPALDPDAFLHDRYLYLPSMGLAILVAIAIRKVRAGKGWLFGIPASQAALVGVLTLAVAAASASQQIYWANDVLLFSRATEIAPGSAAAFNNLGMALASRGRMREAMFAFQQVIKRNPRSWIAQYNVGLGYFMDGKYLDAEVYLQNAVELNPVEGDPSALLAEARMRQGKFSDAEPAILHAIAVQPYKPGYHRVLALCLEGEGRFREAMQAAQEELAPHPQDEKTRELLARLTQEINRK